MGAFTLEQVQAAIGLGASAAPIEERLDKAMPASSSSTEAPVDLNLSHVSLKAASSSTSESATLDNQRTIEDRVLLAVKNDMEAGKGLMKSQANHAVAGKEKDFAKSSKMRRDANELSDKSKIQRSEAEGEMAMALNELVSSGGSLAVLLRRLRGLRKERGAAVAESETKKTAGGGGLIEEVPEELNDAITLNLTDSSLHAVGLDLLLHACAGGKDKKTAYHRMGERGALYAKLDFGLEDVDENGAAAPSAAALAGGGMAPLSLRRLCLDSNYFGDEGVDVLSKFMKLDVLDEVSLQNVGLTEAGFGVVIASLLKCKRIRVVDLRNNALISPDFDKDLALTGLRHFNTKCKVLF